VRRVKRLRSYGYRSAHKVRTHRELVRTGMSKVPAEGRPARGAQSRHFNGVLIVILVGYATLSSCHWMRSFPWCSQRFWRRSSGAASHLYPCGGTWRAALAKLGVFQRASPL